MNKALLVKMTQEVVSNFDKLWIEVFKKKYVQNKNFTRMPMLKGVS